MFCQSVSWMACHISRSYCSPPVALFQGGCLGVPAQPVNKKQITKDRNVHKESTGRLLRATKSCIIESLLKSIEQKGAQGISLCAPSCPLWLLFLNLQKPLLSFPHAGHRHYGCHSQVRLR